MLILGMDVADVAVASYLAFDPDQGDLRILAIATSLRHRGLGLGGDALDVSLEVLRRTRDENDLDCGVFAYVHPSNAASRALFASRDFVLLGLYDGYEGWVHDLD
ncbi:hypothetical protein EDD28_2455 [Salana multivorans]|uniref:N-acetyltransferase domain-containing protein n=1 Tax=Salana multivorans TaxID=120377 RepID=A0A3N2DDJ6_9MICO|nr:hypothetical protein [Salana multivorans]ROR94017.1 hypothetical protein EDD28_3447 [Salana multivorans]ROR97846.1 hypothetical protein EDD28_2455 [Salana multivorans]